MAAEEGRGGMVGFSGNESESQKEGCAGIREVEDSGWRGDDEIDYLEDNLGRETESRGRHG